MLRSKLKLFPVKEFKSNFVFFKDYIFFIGLPPVQENVRIAKKEIVKISRKNKTFGKKQKETRENEMVVAVFPGSCVEQLTIVCNSLFFQF